jgi:hypothetical protein
MVDGVIALQPTIPLTVAAVISAATGPLSADLFLQSRSASRSGLRGPPAYLSALRGPRRRRGHPYARLTPPLGLDHRTG